MHNALGKGPEGHAPLRLVAPYRLQEVELGHGMGLLCKIGQPVPMGLRQHQGRVSGHQSGQGLTVSPCRQPHQLLLLLLAQILSCLLFRHHIMSPFHKEWT